VCASTRKRIALRGLWTVHPTPVCGSVVLLLDVGIHQIVGFRTRLHNTEVTRETHCHSQGL